MQLPAVASLSAGQVATSMRSRIDGHPEAEAASVQVTQHWTLRVWHEHNNDTRGVLTSLRSEVHSACKQHSPGGCVVNLAGQEGARRLRQRSLSSAMEGNSAELELSRVLPPNASLSAQLEFLNMSDAVLDNATLNSVDAEMAVTMRGGSHEAEELEYTVLAPEAMESAMAAELGLAHENLSVSVSAPLFPPMTPPGVPTVPSAAPDAPSKGIAGSESPAVGGAGDSVGPAGSINELDGPRPPLPRPPPVLPSASPWPPPPVPPPPLLPFRLPAAYGTSPSPLLAEEQFSCATEGDHVRDVATTQDLIYAVEEPTVSCIRLLAPHYDLSDGVFAGGHSGSRIYLNRHVALVAADGNAATLDGGGAREGGSGHVEGLCLEEARMLLLGSASRVELHNVVITGGCLDRNGGTGDRGPDNGVTASADGSVGLGNADGAGVWVSRGAMVRIVGCTIDGNTAGVFDSGRTLVQAGTLAAIGDGAGLFNAGITLLEGCVVNSNHADGDGGGLYNSYWLYLDATTISNNTACCSRCANGHAQGCSGGHAFYTSTTGKTILGSSGPGGANTFEIGARASEIGASSASFIHEQSNFPTEWWCAPGRWTAGGQSIHVKTFLDATTALGSKGVLVGCMYLCPAGVSGYLSFSAATGRYLDRHTNDKCNGACPAGHYCPEGNGAPLPCPVGTRQPILRAAEATHCEDCATGTYSNLTGQPECTPCAAGTYTDRKRQTECTECPAGGYCEEVGADTSMVWTRCPAGTWSDIIGANSSAACKPCPEGTFSPAAGAVSASACGPCVAGAYCLAGAAQPSLCSVGSFQDEVGATACKVCSAAAYCDSESATAPVPCAGGTWSNQTGLWNAAQCIKVVSGQWSPMGALQPEACPVSGFFCPGYDGDQVNDPPGSKPILIDAGSRRVAARVPAVSLRVELSASLSNYSETVGASGLAQLYAPHVEAAAHVTLRLLMSSGGGSVTYAVGDGSSAAGGVRAEPQENVGEPLRVKVTLWPSGHSSVAQLLEAVQAASSASVLTEAFGVPATLDPRGAAVVEILEVLRTGPCPKGHWCTAGDAIACNKNTFNNVSGSDDMSACIPCHPNARSPLASTSEANCTCRLEYFDRSPLPETVECARCPIGSACTVGATTTATLPLAVGYYRTSPASEDLRRCPDFGDDSACVGGVGRGEGPCAPLLRGPYCRLCDEDQSNSSVALYYSDEDSTCLECTGVAGFASAAALLLAVAVALVLWAWLSGRGKRLQLYLEDQAREVEGRLQRCLEGRFFLRWVLWLYRMRELHFESKWKTVVDFYQVCTHIENVYKVTLPASVRKVLSGIDFVNFNPFQISNSQLSCFGVGSYQDRLLFTVIYPFTVVFFVVVFFVGKAYLLRRDAKKKDGENMEKIMEKIKREEKAQEAEARKAADAAKAQAASEAKAAAAEAKQAAAAKAADEKAAAAKAKAEKDAAAKKQEEEEEKKIQFATERRHEKKERLQRRHAELDDGEQSRGQKDRPGRQTFDERKQQAATLIQAIARGRAARLRLKSRIHAATLIQAHARGKSVRTAMEQRQPSALPPSPPPSPPEAASSSASSLSQGKFLTTRHSSSMDSGLETEGRKHGAGLGAGAGAGAPPTGMMSARQFWDKAKVKAFFKRNATERSQGAESADPCLPRDQVRNFLRQNDIRLSNEMLDKVIKRFDEDGNDLISYEEFCNLVTELTELRKDLALSGGSTGGMELPAQPLPRQGSSRDSREQIMREEARVRELARLRALRQLTLDEQRAAMSSFKRCNVELSPLRLGALDSLGWVLKFFFLAMPSVSSTAFLVFDCEDFDNGLSYLRADYALQCDTPEYERLVSLAWLAIGLYPVAITVVQLLLLIFAREAIAKEETAREASELANALKFLYQDYKPGYCGWELWNCWRKLLLVGFLVVIFPHLSTLVQLVAAFSVCLASFFLESLAAPQRREGDHYFVQACLFALSAVFFFCIVLVVGTLVEEVDDEGLLTESSRSSYEMDTVHLSVALMCSILSALALAGILAVGQIRRNMQQPQFRLTLSTHIKDDKPWLPLTDGRKWHLFLSHVWSTGQDQNAIIKRQLQLLLPGVRVFLDVDDLEDIGNLEHYIRDSINISFFCSKNYFKSYNCQKEVREAILCHKRGEARFSAQAPDRDSKPDPHYRIILLHDENTEKCGTLKEVQDECKRMGKQDDDDESMWSDSIWKEFKHGQIRSEWPVRPVIPWHRIKDYQQVSLRLLTEQLLIGLSPHGSPHHKAIGKREKSKNDLVAPEHFIKTECLKELYLSSEKIRRNLYFPKPVCLYVSKNHELSQTQRKERDSLKAEKGSEGQKSAKDKRGSAMNVALALKQVFHDDPNLQITTTPSRYHDPPGNWPHECTPQGKMPYPPNAISKEFSPAQRWQIALRAARSTTPEQLIKQRWQIALRAARSMTMSSTTPEQLIKPNMFLPKTKDGQSPTSNRGIYDDVAIAWEPGPFRLASIAQLALKLGAKDRPWWKRRPKGDTDVTSSRRLVDIQKRLAEAEKPPVENLDPCEEPATHFLLYLSQDTWVPGTEQRDELAREVWPFLFDRQVPIVLVHEKPETCVDGADNGGCQFSRFFSEEAVVSTREGGVPKQASKPRASHEHTVRV